MKSLRMQLLVGVCLIVSISAFGMVLGFRPCYAQDISAEINAAQAKEGGSRGSTGCTGGSNVSVTSIVANSDSSSDPFQWQSDGKGPYTALTTRQDSVTSEIQGNSCDWLFDTTASTSRAIVVTLSHQASSASAASPFPTATRVTSRVISKCALNTANNGISYGTMTSAGQQLQCELSIGEMSFNGKTFGVRFEPENFPGATWVQVTCTGAVSSHCNSWTVTPIANTVDPYTRQTSGIGELVQISTAKGQSVETPLGLYYVAFSVTIHE